MNINGFCSPVVSHQYNDEDVVDSDLDFLTEEDHKRGR